MNRLSHILILLALTISASAATWTTHFAYNDVNRIDAGGGMVYGVSSGALFAIDAQTERIRTYSRQDGMHGHDIACIKWLNPANALMIVYEDGKVDILQNETFRYIPDLYTKNVTFSKKCHSITVQDSLAYMAMDYGIQTFHVRKFEFIDTYFIGPEASEIKINSVALAGGMIYAAADTTLYAASLADNVVDFSFWSEQSLPASGTIQEMVAIGDWVYILMNNVLYGRYGVGAWYPIYNQGVTYKHVSVLDGVVYPSDYPAVSCDGIWMAAGDNGIIRQMPTGERITYHLDGPLNNLPYRLCAYDNQLFMLPGGRWAVQNNTPGCVMRYDGSSWHNISQQEIVDRVGAYCLDMMNVAVDPSDSTHYFVTSYGTGLYEFQGEQCINRWNASNSIIGSAAPTAPLLYTRTDGAVYDQYGNLWVMAAGDVDYNIVVFAHDGQQIGMNVQNTSGAKHVIHTVGQLIFDHRQPNLVWVLSMRSNAALALYDTQGTINNTEDDRSLCREKWKDADGNDLVFDALYVMRQDSQGNIWIGTNDGIYIYPAEDDYFQSDRLLHLYVQDEDDEELFKEESIKDIAFDHMGRAWIASSSTGVYVLSATGDSLLAHYTMDNTPLPSNSIMSLAYVPGHGRMYVGSALGLVSYTDVSSDVSTDGSGSQNDLVDVGTMNRWSTHFAYTSIDDIQLSSSNVYALSEGSLCAIDKQDESMRYYSKLNGLTGSAIHRIACDPQTQTLLISYEDGMVDLLSADQNIYSIADLYLKQMNASKQVQDVTFHNGMAYMAMPFGILALNLRKHEIRDTYYIGDEGAELPVSAITVLGDSLYAASGSTVYQAHIDANLVDYALWYSKKYPAPIHSMLTHNNALYMLMDSVVYRNGQPVSATVKFASMSCHDNHLLAITKDGRVFDIQSATATELTILSAHTPSCAIREGAGYWLGTNDGVLYVSADGSVQAFKPDGPSSNMPYSLTTAGSELWAVPGGRWASGEMRQGQVMYFNGTHWDNLTYNEICRRLNNQVSLYDFGHVAVDPTDSRHFYVASYGTGLIEFQSNGWARRFNHNNSPLVSLVSGTNSYRYCRVDAMTFDADRNLWLTNVGDLATNIHIIDPEGQWHSFNIYRGSQRIVLNTVSKLLVDNRYPNYKWIACARDQASIVLLNDNGTPYKSSDDRAIQRSSFIDQDNKPINLDRLGTIAQDYNGDMWLGTGEGIVVIDASTDLFQSNACRRLKISRHDGTNLADYLLGTEQINAILFAGGDRIWIGTEVSGVYLVHMVTKEGIYEPEILAHFTTANSPMPSDNVLSLAINKNNGEIYIGTSKGLVSYRGDATDPADNYSNAYVYPNPVRPNYQGLITINGLMDNTTVYIADAAGNVVCRTHSQGGTAVWDGKTHSGKRAHTGVYTVYCNTADGQHHAVVKFMIMH